MLNRIPVSGSQRIYAVGALEVAAWGPDRRTGPTELHVRLDVPGAPCPVNLVLTTAEEVDALVDAIQMIRASIWPTP